MIPVSLEVSFHRRDHLYLPFQIPVGIEEHQLERCFKAKKLVEGFLTDGRANRKKQRTLLRSGRKEMTHHPQMGSVSVDNCLHVFTYVNVNAISHLTLYG